jgi:hypothetical protein
MNKKSLLSGIATLGLAVIILSSCQKQGPQLPLWLEGTWETGDTIGLAAESWEQINSEYMSGEGLFITRDKKSVVEMLNIFIQDGKLVYTALVPGENNGEEIIFIDSNLQADSLVFINTKHDYPKKIVYYRESHQRVQVYLFGINNKPDKTLTLKKVEE